MGPDGFQPQGMAEKEPGLGGRYPLNKIVTWRGLAATLRGMRIPGTGPPQSGATLIPPQLGRD